MNLDAVDNDKDLCGGNKLHGGSTRGNVSSPVVDLNTSDDGIVSLLGIDGLLNEVLKIAGDGALADMSKLHKVQLGVVLLLKSKPPCKPLLEDRKFRLKRIVDSRNLAVGIVALRLEEVGALQARRLCQKQNQQQEIRARLTA